MDVGLPRQTVTDIIKRFAENGKIAEIGKTPPESLQYTNHWDFDGCDPAFGEKYPGRLQDRLLSRYRESESKRDKQ